jgi:hypothetical protein
MAVVANAAFASGEMDRAHMVSEPVDRFDTRVIDRPANLQAVAWLARWATATSVDCDTGSYPPLEPIIDQARSAGAEAASRSLMEVASFAFIAARDAVWADIAREIIDRARDDRTIFPLPNALSQLSLSQSTGGRGSRRNPGSMR